VDDFFRNGDRSGAVPGQNSAQPIRPFSPVTLADKPVPPRKWLVPEWIPWSTVTGLYGDGGVGKSLLAQQLLTATAIGKPFLGLPVTQVRSIGVFCEDPLDELHRRQADINRFYESDFAELRNTLWLPRFGEDNLLMNARGELTPFFNDLREQALQFKARLVIVDTVADTFGGNENDRGQVRQYIQSCLGRLARDIDGCVVALAHPSRSGMASGSGDSGSTGWSNSFRSRIVLEVPNADDGTAPDPDVRFFWRKKANYALRKDWVRVRWQNGILVPEKSAMDGSGAAPRRPCTLIFLDILDVVTRENRAVSENSRASNYAPRLFAKRPEREGYAKQDFERAMESLFSDREIRIQEYGRSGDLRHRIVRNPPSAQTAQAAD
jgi:RecA-family ATPase